MPGEATEILPGTQSLKRAVQGVDPDPFRKLSKNDRHITLILRWQQGARKGFVMALSKQPTSPAKSSNLQQTSMYLGFPGSWFRFRPAHPPLPAPWVS